MAKTKITAPVAQPGEVTGVGGLVFTDGVAETDNDAIIAYCEAQGYGIGSKKPSSPAPDTDETSIGSVDSRELHANGPTIVGTPARDAAVDPHPEDYLVPVNAGKADPHGPLVVAPEIHNSSRGPHVPGAVTEAKEKTAAERALVDGKNVHEVSQSLAGDNTGPLDLSDPSSGDYADTGIAPLEGDAGERNTDQRQTAKRTAKKSTAPKK
jgi:hypothetical protein